MNQQKHLDGSQKSQTSPKTSFGKKQTLSLLIGVTLIALVGAYFLPQTNFLQSRFTGNVVITSANLASSWEGNPNNPFTDEISKLGLKTPLESFVKTKFFTLGAEHNLSDAKMKIFLGKVASGLRSLNDKLPEGPDTPAIRTVLGYIIHEASAAEAVIGLTPNVASSNPLIGLAPADITTLKNYLTEEATSGNFTKSVAYVLKNSIAPYYILEVAKSMGPTQITEQMIVDYINSQYQAIQDNPNLGALKPTSAQINLYKSLYGKDGSIASVLRSSLDTTHAANTNNTQQGAGGGGGSDGGKEQAQGYTPQYTTRTNGSDTVDCRKLGTPEEPNVPGYLTIKNNLDSNIEMCFRNKSTPYMLYIPRMNKFYPATSGENVVMVTNDILTKDSKSNQWLKDKNYFCSSYGSTTGDVRSLLDRARAVSLDASSNYKNNNPTWHYCQDLNPPNGLPKVVLYAPEVDGTCAFLHHDHESFLQDPCLRGGAKGVVATSAASVTTSSTTTTVQTPGVAVTVSDGPQCTPGNEETYYLEKNPDVKNAVTKGDYPNGASHWNTYGKNEGRTSCWTGLVPVSAPAASVTTPSTATTVQTPAATVTVSDSPQCTPGNEEAYYIAANPSVKDSGMTPTQHWNEIGIRAGLQSCWVGAVVDHSKVEDKSDSHSTSPSQPQNNNTDDSQRVQACINLAVTKGNSLLNRNSCNSRNLTNSQANYCRSIERAIFSVQSAKTLRQCNDEANKM